MNMRAPLTSMILLLCGITVADAQTLPAFPGAEGFGAVATGGRGGRVIYVTRLDADQDGVIPGTFNWALRQTGPRYILFNVSGVINAPGDIIHGDVTIAGQTSPGGVIVRGLLCDGHYEANICDNLIIRNMRSRPAGQLPIPPGGAVLDDGVRMDGVHKFIIDRTSIANASDETVQISWASQGTIQNSILAETVGDHAQWGGMLMNYERAGFPQDQLSFHHNLWFRLGGRLPEITCEASTTTFGDTPPFSIAECQAQPLHLELSDNLQFDPGINIWYNHYIDQVQSNGPYVVNLNMLDNYVISRAGYGFGLILIDMLQEPKNQLYFSGNRMQAYPDFSDYQLAYCCNDFPSSAPNTDFGTARRLSQRLPFPPITYDDARTLPTIIPDRAGAFPRDPMDRRIIARVRTGVPQILPWSQPEANDALTQDFTAATAPPPPVDSDGDGMPDWFEQKYAYLGLDPHVPQANGHELSVPLTGVAGYDNIEVYLNLLSDGLAIPPPAANFSFVTNGLTANFSDSSTDSGGTIVSHAWNFGDSATSPLTSPSHTYAASGPYYVSDTVTDNRGATSTKTSLVAVNSGGVLQLLGNTGFEKARAPWTTTTGVLQDNSALAHSGNWFAAIGNGGTGAHSDQVYQWVTIPSGKTSATLSFYLHTTTAETTTTQVNDVLRVLVYDATRTLIGTLATYSNLHVRHGYVHQTLDMTPYLGRKVEIRFLGTNNATLETTWSLDDVTLDVQ